MAIDHGHSNGEFINPSVKFDKSDLSARGILIFFLVLAISAGFIHLVVLGMYVGMTKYSEKHEKDVSPLAPNVVSPRSGILTNTANVDIKRFPEPRLQSDEISDMTRLLLAENAALNASSSQDAQGVQHMPINQAMQTLVPKLPTRSGETRELPLYPGAARQYSQPPVTEPTQSAYDMRTDPFASQNNAPGR